jgi:phosphoglycerate dehydrogenase-like enzyme
MKSIKIVSYASQNPVRQEELREAIAAMAPSMSPLVTFPSTDEQAAAELHDADILFTWRLTEEMFLNVNRLSWVHLGGAGVDRILFPAFRESDVVLTNSRGMHGEFIAEWTLGALFHISQHFKELEAWRRDREWKSHKEAITGQRFLLGGKRALIYGYGAIGRSIAQKLQSLGVNCEGVVSFPRKSDIPLHTLSDAIGIVERFDITVIALPLTNQTRGLFDSALLFRMKPGSILVNVARGAIVNETALIDCLRDGPLAAAALDVFVDEPLPADSPLFSIPNLFMTPHISGNFPDYSAVANQIFLDNLGRFLSGESLRNIIDKKRGY